MKFDLLKTRRYKLQNKLKIELNKVAPDIEKILNSIDDYEKDNLETIRKLKREKQVTTKKINGALKSCITAHGPITKLLIGSATKRIYGNLLTKDPAPEPKLSASKLSWQLLQISIWIGLLILYVRMIWG